MKQKRTYITPALRVIKIRRPSLLAGSNFEKGRSIPTSVYDDDVPDILPGNAL